MCTTYTNLLEEQFRHNIHGKKVMFVDRCYTGLNGERVVNELSLEQNNTLSRFLICIVLALPCCYALWKGQNLLLVSISIGVLLTACFIYLHFFWIKKECLTVIRFTGVQLTTIYATGRRQTHFVELHYIKDIVINEAVTMHKVVYYLAILLNDQNHRQAANVLPVFLHSMPRLDMLIEIYQSVHKVLWDELAAYSPGMTTHDR